MFYTWHWARQTATRSAARHCISSLDPGRPGTKLPMICRSMIHGPTIRRAEKYCSTADAKNWRKRQDLPVAASAKERYEWAMSLDDERRAQLVMDDVEEFLQVHRQKLLRYLDGEAPLSSDDPGPMDYVAQVLDEWSGYFSGRVLRVPCLRERTFWFALYQLEELVENPVQGNLDSYEAVLLQSLAEVREILRGWQELPEKYYATRPGEI